MGILNDNKVWIAQSMHQVISPYEISSKRSPKGISYGPDPCGYSLRIGNEFKIIRWLQYDIGKEKAPQMDTFKPHPDGKIMLNTNQLLLANTLEYINMPANLFGVCYLKSTWSRTGLVMNASPIWPGWKGHITLELANPCKHSIAIYPNEPMVTIVFNEVDPPANLYHGQYQDQTNITTAKTTPPKDVINK